MFFLVALVTTAEYGICMMLYLLAKFGLISHHETKIVIFVLFFRCCRTPKKTHNSILKTVTNLRGPFLTSPLAPSGEILSPKGEVHPQG
jgi:hypothetical protein